MRGRARARARVRAFVCVLGPYNALGTTIMDSATSQESLVGFNA